MCVPPFGYGRGYPKSGGGINPNILDRKEAGGHTRRQQLGHSIVGGRAAMADIEFACPACEQVLEAPDDMGGMPIECPACGNQITIPHPSELGSGESVEEPPPPQEPEGEDPVAGGETCSECGADMAAGAVLCMHCGFHKELGKKISTEFS